MAGRNPEEKRLIEAEMHEYDWKLWGPYLAERQWATVREDYSSDGNCWDYFNYEMAARRAYRWGEDGLFGFSDRLSRLCFSMALWNGHDPLLKERLFGLSGPEGNHGEDVKEEYFYLDSTPTHSYMKALYKYPNNLFPYEELRRVNKQRSTEDDEYEITDTDAFNDNNYCDIQIEYAKADGEDILINITVSNRSSAATSLWLLPQFWARNTWSWGAHHEGENHRSEFRANGSNSITTEHISLGQYTLDAQGLEATSSLTQIFTENESDHGGERTDDNWLKDAFHRYIINDDKDAVNPKHIGSKAAFVYKLDLAAQSSQVIRLRLYKGSKKSNPFSDFETILSDRQHEADHFYDSIIDPVHAERERQVMRQAYAGLLWSKQFYYYVVKEWLRGDSLQPTPPSDRDHGRNHDWTHLYNRDIISMPDKWEYPWYAAWDLAFHMIPFAKIDQDFAQKQLILFLREWYMHPNGQIPAYEFEFGAVNPPVHAWAALKVYESSGLPGWRDRDFLSRIFQKLLINFTWWVNRTDISGRNLFSGGFLGLDNIGIFDRGATLPTGGTLEQADGTAWMGFYCANLLEMALELAREDRSYSDTASKFFEHFLTINDAMNGKNGLWNEEDGFYYDMVRVDDQVIPMKIRSMVGLIPLFAVSAIEEHTVNLLPGFQKRMNWFLLNKPDMAMHLIYSHDNSNSYLLSLVDKFSLRRILKYVFDEEEFLSPYGIRSLSKFHKDHPFIFEVDGEEYRVDYTPGNSTTTMFGGNSNWRGPIWFPLNYLLVESLLRYAEFYGDSFTIEYPTGSGEEKTLSDIAADICCRLSRLFLKDPESNKRPCWGDDETRDHEHWDEHILFHEFFHGDDGTGLGASHQTGWTSLVTWCLEKARALGAKP
ncbi:MAG: glucosidase [Planctomycetes bacterium]|nr:glucosidase [Planctomycetota bacterium]